jgi:hypothetical protein
MCYNKESSITSYIQVLCLALGVFMFGDKTDKYMAVVFATIIQMQLAEYFMWTDKECGDTNNYATYGAYIVLLLQPLAMLIGGYALGATSIPRNYVVLGSILLISGFGYNLFNYANSNSKKCSKPNKNGNLVWDFTLAPMDPIVECISKIVYFTGLFLPLFFIKDPIKRIFLAVAFIGSFLLHVTSYEDWYSLWCYSVKHLFIVITFVSIVLKFIAPRGSLKYA